MFGALQLGMGLTRRSGGFSPAALFAAGEVGVWYDPSDLTTLFTDTAGTTPVTTPGQTVALMRDKSGRSNHATQATTLSRPTYAIEPMTGRRNLLTWTEQFDNAAWQKNAVSVPATNGVAPNGTSTADTLREDGTNNGHSAQQNPSASASTAYTVSAYFKREAGTRNAFIQANNNVSGTGGACFAWFDLGAGTSSAVTDLVPGFTSTSAAITDAGNGWYRCVLRFTTVAGTASLGISYGLYNAARVYTGDGTSGILVWGAQLELGSTATPYQRVTTQFDVTEAGVASKSYLFFDGSDDFMLTGTITPGVDKAQVFAGVRKVAGAGFQTLAGFGFVQAGAFFLYAPTSVKADYGLYITGNSGGNNKTTDATFTPPITNVVAGFIDGAQAQATQNTMRVNGASAAISAGGAMTLTSFAAERLYLGRRQGSDLPFNGNLYGLITRFSAANMDAATIGSTETWLNQRTGAY